MKSSKLFDKIVNDIIQECMTSLNTFGVGSIEQHGGEVDNTDFYAPGDARVPKVLGKKSKKKKKKGKRNKTIPAYIQTR